METYKPHITSVKPWLYLPVDPLVDLGQQPRISSTDLGVVAQAGGVIKHDATVVESRRGKLPVRREAGCRHHVLALHPVHDSSHAKHGGSERTASTASQTQHSGREVGLVSGADNRIGVGANSATACTNHQSSACCSGAVRIVLYHMYKPGMYVPPSKKEDNQPSQATPPNVSLTAAKSRPRFCRRQDKLYSCCTIHDPSPFHRKTKKQQLSSVFSLAPLSPSLFCIVSPTIRDLPEPKALVEASRQEDVVVERVEVD